MNKKKLLALPVPELPKRINKPYSVISTQHGDILQIVIRDEDGLCIRTFCDGKNTILYRQEIQKAEIEAETARQKAAYSAQSAAQKATVKVTDDILKQAEQVAKTGDIKQQMQFLSKLRALGYTEDQNQYVAAYIDSIKPQATGTGNDLPGIKTDPLLGHTLGTLGTLGKTSGTNLTQKYKNIVSDKSTKQKFEDLR